MHVPLDRESSLPKTFNAPWGKCLWLRLSFGLTVEGDMIQERVGNVLKSVPSDTGITEDILDHSNVEISYDSPVINLLETA